MKLRALCDTFVVARLYRKDEEFEALNFDGIARECVEVLSGEPVATPKRSLPVRRLRSDAPAPATAAAAAEAMAASSRLSELME